MAFAVEDEAVRRRAVGAQSPEARRLDDVARRADVVGDGARLVLQAEARRLVAAERPRRRGELRLAGQDVVARREAVAIARGVELARGEVEGRPDPEPRRLVLALAEPRRVDVDGEAVDGQPRAIPADECVDDLDGRPRAQRRQRRVGRGVGRDVDDGRESHSIRRRRRRRRRDQRRDEPLGTPSEGRLASHQVPRRREPAGAGDGDAHDGARHRCCAHHTASRGGVDVGVCQN